MLHIAFLLLLLSPLMAQEQRVPVRTPEEEAMKQTEMLQRELDLSQAQHDTIYLIYLKYAVLRRQSNTRQEALERLNSMTAEIMNVLSPGQQQKFLGKQINDQPRRAMPRMVAMPNDTLRDWQPVGGE